MLKINEVYKEKESRPEKILSIGEGNFLRAFACRLVDDMNEKGVYSGNIVLCQPIEDGKCDDINAQNGLYTVIERTAKGNEAIESAHVIKSVSRCINPYEDFEQFLKIGRSPDLEVIISNTTEAGIAFDSTDKFEDAPYVSYPAKLTRLLYERLCTFKTHGKLLILPAELIDSNGTKLKECVEKYIQLWHLPQSFSAWLNAQCIFANTLVDRIVSGYPEKDAKRLSQKLGYKDNLLTAAEPFFFWAIELENEAKSIFPANKSGFDVIFAKDITPYKTRKVRILNGAHTLSVLAAFLSGHNTVFEMMSDSIFELFISETLKKEIIPFINLKESEKNAFAKAVIERFKNPFLGHRLLDISLNSVSKYKARCLPSVLDYAKEKGEAPSNLSFALAALLIFYKGKWQNGEYIAFRNGEKYKISDDIEVLRVIEKSDINTILSNKDLWGMDLRTIPEFAKKVITAYHDIEKYGVLKAVSLCIKQS
ncbi:MAG TPA: tagaturonate reductase [Oscillospiraceae bacterium]|nr:tagaturonate reductase [Oscillospiraceae bacterium]